jgi:hypothetical protein
VALIVYYLVLPIAACGKVFYFRQAVMLDSHRLKR